MTSASARSGLRIRKIVTGNGALGGLMVLVVALSIVTPTFLTAQNLVNVGVQAAVVAVLALGSTFVIVSGGIDLSVGSAVGDGRRWSAPGAPPRPDCPARSPCCSA